MSERELEHAGFFAGYDEGARRARRGLEPLAPPPSLPESQHAAWYRDVARLEARDKADARERERRRLELDERERAAAAGFAKWERETFAHPHPVVDYLGRLAGDSIGGEPSPAAAVAAELAELDPLQGLTRGELEAALLRREPPRPARGLGVDTELRESLDRVEGYERRFADRADLLRAVQSMPALRGHRVRVCLRYMAAPRRAADAGGDPLASMSEHELGATVQVVGRRSRVAPDLDGLPVPPSLANLARYRGVAVCGSGWVCPMCASRITEGRRRELERAVGRHLERGGVVLLATQTFSHGRSDKLADAWDALGRARQRFARSSTVKRFREAVGFVGRVAAREVTYGLNGWHPHAHELIFAGAELTAERVAELELELAKEWRACCAAVGLEASLEHGFKLSLTAAATYIAKWGLDSELTKWQLKRGRVAEGHEPGELALAGYTPFDLLRIYARVMPDPRLNLSPAHAGHLFAEYVEAVVGTAQLHWTRGLKAELGVDELTDDELAEADEVDDVLLGTIDAHQWFVLVHRRNQVEFLGLVAAQGFAAARVLLEAWVEDFDRRSAASVRRLLFEQRRRSFLRGGKDGRKKKAA